MKNTVKIYHWIYIPIALALISISIYFENYAEFCKEENFSKDVCVKLPEYSIKEKKEIQIEDGSSIGWGSYDSLMYKLQLAYPISDNDVKTITEERKGWTHVDGERYELHKSILSEDIFCYYEIGASTIQISYCYNYMTHSDNLSTMLLIILLTFFYALLLLIIAGLTYHRMSKQIKLKVANGGPHCPESHMFQAFILLVLFWPLGVYIINRGFGILQLYLNNDYDNALRQSEFLRKFSKITIILIGGLYIGISIIIEVLKW